MKMFRKMFMLLALAAATATAQTPISCSPTEASKHVGEFAAITGQVDGFHESGKGNLFLNMGGKYPNQAFTAYIPAASASSVPNAKAYEGKTVVVTGKIELYRGKPEIPC